MLKGFAAMPGVGAEAALQYLRGEEQRDERQRRDSKRDGTRLGGFVATAGGTGLLVFLRAITERPAYLVGLIPILVGFALVGYSYILSREGALRSIP